MFDTATTLTSSPNPAMDDDPVTITTRTTVVGSDQPVLSGNVEILSGGKLVTTVPVGADGQATWTTKDLPIGEDYLSAVFLDTTTPSAAYRSSETQGILNQIVRPCAPAPTFLDQPADLTATYGTAVTFSVSVSETAVYGGTPQVKWQTSTDGGKTWTDAPGDVFVEHGTTSGSAWATMSFDASVRPGDLQYRAVATTCGGTVTSDPATLTVRGIVFDLTTLPSKSFGDAAFDIASYASASTVTVGFSSDTPGTCTVSGAMVTVRASGTCTITASEDGISNYALAPQVKQSFSSGKKLLTVVATAAPLSQPYGTASAPTVSCTSNGFVGSDHFVTAPTGQMGGYTLASGSTSEYIFRPVTIGSTTPQGRYVSHCSGGNPGPSYTIGSYRDGTFTITAPLPPPLKITANDKRYTFGTTPPSLDATYSISTSSLTGTLSCRVYASTDTGYANPIVLSETTPAGSYTIHCSGLSSSSYTVSWADGTLVVDRAAVVVTASSPPDQSHGSTSAPSVTCPATGFLGEDGFLTEPTGAVYDASGTEEVTIGSDAAVGDYVTKCTGGDPGSNYTITGYTPGSFTIEDRTAPVVTVPADMGVEATGPAGATATFGATARDAVDGTTEATCDPASDSTFALGTTTVTCSATDAAGNTGTASFTVTVSDTTAPVVTVPANKKVEATGPAGAKATFGATAQDAVDGTKEATCDPASDSTFALGATMVTCSATDAAGNTGTASFTVTVADTIAPDTRVTVTQPANPTKQTAAGFTFDGSDLVGVAGFECKLDGGTFTACTSPKTYSGLAEGSHAFQVRARDAAGNVDLTPAGYSWVVDTTAPTVTVADVILDATSSAGASVPFTATATDADPVSPEVTCSRASGSTFGIGTTQVTCTATDAAGNTGSATFTVTVKGAVTQLTALQAKVQNLSSAPARKSLLTTLQSAQAAVSRGDTSAACDKLTSFISQVEAQSGKKISTSDAASLIRDARRIMGVLGCS
ncbi:HYR domain-containing protein [Nocardioides mesophilus]|uniref:HYR domain-containing protein n=1 Tax=Nocardioides mesophilus TaxID=433659 RepID=A0A7G9RDB3_9ACTN|nr:HYR domain-containing protein [Nocardioides mesophilus]QNN53588.1 HYR domain-containing protein [Nocardioides mesophilus]